MKMLLRKTCFANIDDKDCGEGNTPYRTTPATPTMMPIIPIIPKLVANSFRVNLLLSSNWNSAVFAGTDISGSPVAVKVSQAGRLESELNIYKKLEIGTKHNDFSKVLYYGLINGSDIIVMNFQGASVHRLLYYEKGGVFRVKTALNIVKQTTNKLKILHNAGIVHGNVEPRNILVESWNQDQSEILQQEISVFLIDFRCSCLFGSGKTPVVQPLSLNMRRPEGLSFAAVSYHKGHSISPKDDLESLLYVFIFMCKGDLPWYFSPNSSTDTTIDIMGKMKDEIDLHELFKSLPMRLSNMLRYIRSLGQGERPDYFKIQKYITNAELSFV